MKLTLAVALLVIQGFTLTMCRHKCSRKQANSRPTTKEICRGSQETISCPEGKVLKIVDAKYGRKNTATCHYETKQTTTCKRGGGGKLKKIVKDWCNGLPSCTIQANSSFFGDPCYIYVTVKYQCKPGQGPVPEPEQDPVPEPEQDPVPEPEQDPVPQEEQPIP